MVCNLFLAGSTVTRCRAPYQSGATAIYLKEGGDGYYSVQEIINPAFLQESNLCGRHERESREINLAT